MGSRTRLKLEARHSLWASYSDDKNQGGVHLRVPDALRADMSRELLVALQWGRQGLQQHVGHYAARLVSVCVHTLELPRK